MATNVLQPCSFSGSWRKMAFCIPQTAESVLQTIPLALTLMIAESRTEEKDVMVKVVVNLINKENQ